VFIYEKIIIKRKQKCTFDTESHSDLALYTAVN